MQNKPLFIVLALTLFALSGAIGYFGPPLLAGYQEERERASFIPPGVPKSKTEAFSRDFQDLSAATEARRLPDEAFTGIDGKTHRFSDFKGKPTLVNFWATWCMPCVVELPSLGEMAEHYKGRMNVVAVALEERPLAEIARFLETREIGGFAGYADRTNAIGKELGLRGIPTSFLIGSDGYILYRFEGDADWASPEARAFFDTFLLQKR